MQVYRLCKAKYSTLDGEGACKTGGSWNSQGKHVIYASQNISLAVLEILVHIDYDLFPDDYVLMTIEIPDDIEKYNCKTLTRVNTRIFGDEWIVNKRTLVLSVPSFIINVDAALQEDRNILINPHHPDFKNVKIFSQEPFKLDDRLFR